MYSVITHDEKKKKKKSYYNLAWRLLYMYMYHLHTQILSMRKLHFPSVSEESIFK